MNPQSAGEDPAPLTLDFANPLAFPLVDPDGLRSNLIDFATTAASRLEISSAGAFLLCCADELNEINSDRASLLADQMKLECIMIQGRSALFQPQGTEHQRRRAIIPAVGAVRKLGEQLSYIETELKILNPSASDTAFLGGGAPSDTLITCLDGSRYRIPDQNENPGFLSDRAMLLREIGHARAAVSAIERTFGTFHIWARSPHAETTHAIFRAFQNGDLDLDDFLRCYLRDDLGREASEYDAYLAQTILGMRESEDGQIRFDGPPDFSRLESDDEVPAFLMNCAAARLYPVRHGTKDRLRIPPLVYRRLQWDAESGQYVDQRDSAKRLSSRFQNGSREVREQIGRTVGWSRQDTRFVASRCDGKVRVKDNEAAWKRVKKAAQTFHATSVWPNRK